MIKYSLSLSLSLLLANSAVAERGTISIDSLAKAVAEAAEASASSCQYYLLDHTRKVPLGEELSAETYKKLKAGGLLLCKGDCPKPDDGADAADAAKVCTDRDGKSQKPSVGWLHRCECV
jgi:hypothetical protein